MKQQKYKAVMMNKFEIEGPNAKVLENLPQVCIQRRFYLDNVYFVINQISASKTLVTKKS